MVCIPPIMNDRCAMNKISKTTVNFYYFPVGDRYTYAVEKQKRNNTSYTYNTRSFTAREI